MSDPRLSRREILSGIVVAGGAGSLVGVGTGALFTDEEVFSSNTVRASTNVGGVLDMGVTLEELPADMDGVRYRVSLPDGESSATTNNPAYIWLRTLECPAPVELAERVQIEVTVTYDGGTAEVLIAEGSVLDILNDLRQGEHVGRLADSPCLQPGEEWLIDIEVTEVTGDEEITEQLTFELEFYGQQCRYQSGAVNPFDESEIIDTCGPDGSDLNGISFIAFCGPSGMNPSVSIPSDAETDADGAPTSLDWETDGDVTYVSMKTGNNWTIYDYREVTKTQGTVESGGDPDAAFFGSINPQGGTASEPCEVAAERAGDSTGFDGDSVKFEFVDGTFEEVDGDG